MEEKKPKVGVGVIIKKENKVLLLKRKNSHGSETWAAIGGHLEFEESWEECAKREVLEEIGISLKNIKFLTATNDLFKREGKHYITIFMTAEISSGEPENLEPEKCEKLEWFSKENLPSNLFTPMENLLKNGFDLFS